MNTAKTKAFFSYVISSVLALVLSGVYTIVDGFFIGQRLGDIGLASITLGYPVSALVGAVGRASVYPEPFGLRFQTHRAKQKNGKSSLPARPY